MLVSSHISFIYNFKSSTKLPPGHFSNKQRWSSTPRLWMRNKHHGWTLSPLASCCSQPLTSAAAFQSIPNGEDWAALSRKELHPRASASFGFTDFLKVIQLFRAAELSVNPASHRPAPPPLTTGQQLVQGGALCRAAGGGSSRGCTSEQRAELRAGTLQRGVSGHKTPHNDLKPLFPSKAGGKGRGTAEKGKDKPHYYTKNVARKKWKLIKSCN